MVPGVLPVQVQGARPADGPLRHLGRAEEQLLLRRRLREGGNGRLHIRNHQIGIAVRVQQQEAAGQVGRAQGELIITSNKNYSHF